VVDPADNDIEDPDTKLLDPVPSDIDPALPMLLVPEIIFKAPLFNFSESPLLILISPEDGAVVLERILSNVDFPAPFGPFNTQRSPRLITQEI
jgi:hypothetical protein